MENKMILTAEETAKLLGIGMNKTYELLVCGEIPSKRIGRKYLIPRLALDIWLSSGNQKEETPYERVHQQSRK
jgi:excisionase family DNA binding protein